MVLQNEKSLDRKKSKAQTTPLTMRDAIVSVITNGDKILTIERAPRGLYVGFWAPVSGKVEPGESQEVMECGA